MISIQGELQHLLYRNSQDTAVINNIIANNHHSALVFSKFAAGEEFEPYGLNGEHYFVAVIATYGRKYDGSRNTKHMTVFEVSKEQSEEIYETVSKSKVFNYNIT